MDKVKRFLKKIKTPAFCASVMLVTVLGVLISSLIYWVLKVWADLTVDEIIFHLKVPLTGTNSELIKDAIITCLPPVIVTIVLVSLAFWVSRGKKKLRIILSNVFMVIAIGMMSYRIWTAIDRLELVEYFANRQNESDFIEDNYVDPRNVKIEFPEKKRNLIYIYLESMENSFASVEEGGVLEENLIPELAAIANQNVNFSNSEKLGGGFPSSGTTWTIAAMFAQTSGLPLKIPLYLNAMSEQETFFPDIVTLGDILEEQGYRQVLMLGSDSVFGGRKNYFTTHGNYEMWDYYTAIAKKKIPEDYKEFWGYEDQKLFEYAKEELMILSKGAQPFNFTMLTVDTHFEDGYLCALCGDEYGDDQYANVVRCASQQISEFVHWLEAQPFYENTTIILAGDHLSMDADFFQGTSKENKRQVYNAFINAPIEPVREKHIEFTTMDFFPTTLASLGVKIEGERLALGTNLFSGEETLMEKNGLATINKEFDSKSEFYEHFAKDIVIPGRFFEDDKGWRYENSDGSYVTNESKEIGNRIYHFDADGYMESFEEVNGE